MNVTFINNTGANVRKITMKETAGGKAEWTSGGMADGDETTTEITTTTVDGAPSIQVTYELEDGRFWGGMILFKGDQVITFTLDKDGAPDGEVKNK